MSGDLLPRPLPFVTGDLPGVGGRFKATPEDFVVEEVPCYQPSGTGEHLFLWVSKVGRSTPDVAAELARRLGIGVGAVGYAGMKDRVSVSRQYFSVPARCESALGALSGSRGFEVLSFMRHGNKLRTGHLLKNRFRIRLRGVRDPRLLEECTERLKALGLANFFGAQRFGHRQDNALRGLELLRGSPAAGRRVERFSRKLWVSALQSEIFNRALAGRVERGTFARALAGDVLRKVDSGGLFVCREPALDQLRVDRFEVSPAGPLPGSKMVLAEGEVGEEERRILAEAGVDLALFKEGKGEASGGRRPYRIRLEHVGLEWTQADAVLSFELPSGSYATVLLRELLKGPDQLID